MTALLFFNFKGDPGALRPPRTSERVFELIGAPRIRCPRCAWEPGREDRWVCSCNFIWNTFDTGGVCPACEHHWIETMCLQCLDWSIHDDWYVEDPEPAP